MSLLRVIALIARRRRRRVAVLVAVFLAVFGAVGWILWGSLRADAGAPSDTLHDPWYRGHRILDAEGLVLRELPGEEGRRGQTTPLHDIGERMILTTLAAEDADFYDHDGIDRVALLRAVQQNVRHGRLVSGGSTITQQLVKLLDTRGIPGERTVPIKAREMARAQNLEDELDKDTILEAYLNRLPYGHGLVGPEAAALGYFGVHSRDLSWAQAAFLAVLPRAPSYLDPTEHPERVVLRQRALLGELEALGLITEVEHRRAAREPIELEELTHPFDAPHFVQMLLAEGRIADGNATHTTIERALQRDVEGLVRTHLGTIRDRLVTDAAVIVIDNDSGDVLAYVGSTDFHDPEIAGQVDMVRARRQPGSALKPFVYALAFERGRTGAEMLADVPTEFSEQGGDIYAPRNFHGGFVGPVPAREALAASLNVPVVRLAADLPAGAMLERLHALGFASLDRSAEHYGLSLALGSGEVELRELAAAYVALARGGDAVALRYTRDDPPAAPRRVIDAAVAAEVTDALSDPLARVRILDGRSPFDIGYPLALKTGTSSGYRDAWTVGFTHERTVAVWLGNADGSAMHEVTGAGGAGPLFADVMRRAMEEISTRGPLLDADALAVVPVCPLSGHLASPACPDAVARRFAPAHAPGVLCSVHRHVRSVPPHDGGPRYVCDPDGPDVVAVLPPAFDRWLQGLPHGAPGKDPAGVPWVGTQDVSACGEDEHLRPTLLLDSPALGSVILLSHDGRDSDRVELVASYTGPHALRPDHVEFVVDGQVVARSPFPYRALVPIGPGDHDVYARPVDPDAPVDFRGTGFSVR
jgi:penicillin-binding protein 1C